MKHDMLRGLSLFYTAADTEIRESLNLPPFALAWSINMRVRRGEDAPTAYARLELQDSAAFEVDPENHPMRQLRTRLTVMAWRQRIGRLFGRKR